MEHELHAAIIKVVTVQNVSGTRFCSPPRDALG
jgi:hypothetical protein